MKKVLIILSAIALMIIPFNLYAENFPAQPPTLKSISFDNAEIDGEFSPAVYEYGVILDNPSLTPTLKDYEIDGNADIFITYETDELKQHTGIIATLEYESGTVVYKFNYKNAEVTAKNSNNFLKKIDCKYGEVFPKLNKDDTKYTLYIPKDMTTLRITAVTDDVSANCDLPSEMTLNAGQELTVSTTVIASNGEKRDYTFEIKRLNKTIKQVEEIMKSPDFETLVTDELFYQKPEFFVTVISICVAAVLFMLFVKLAKRLTVKTYDEDETEFFSL